MSASADVTDEVVGQLRTMRLPYMRRAAPELLKTDRNQRWEPAEVVRALLAEGRSPRRSGYAERRPASLPGRRLRPGMRASPRSPNQLSARSWAWSGSGARRTW